MNSAELKRELDMLVRDVAADGHVVAGVASKVRARKRARAAGIGVACVALLGLGAGVTTQLGGGTRTPAPAFSGHAMPTPTLSGADDGMPSRTVPPPPGDVVKDGLRFRAQVAGAQLAAGVIGAEGQTSLALGWTPSTTRVTIAGECWATALSGSPVPAIDLEVSLDGDPQPAFKGSCVPGSPPAVLTPTGLAPGEPGGPGWDLLAVGRPAELSFRVVDATSGKPVTDGSVRITAAVYDRGAERVLTEPKNGRPLLALPELIEHNGYTYQLATLTSRSPEEKLPAVPTPAGEPFFVAFGSTGDGSVTDALVPTGVRLTGITNDTGLLSGGWSTAAQPARGTGTVALVREGPTPRSGVDFIAIYTPAP